jgi:hypothetical protein
MEPLDFGSGGSTMIQYIPTVDGEPPIERQMGTNTRTEGLLMRGEVPPAGVGAVKFEMERAAQQEKTSDQNNNMDFSTPLSDVMPSAAFDSSPQDAVNSATYTSPTTQRVAAISPGMIGTPQTKKTGNPLGLTDEQFQAALAGLAAVIAFSKPLQEKLSDTVPKFMSEAGELSMTGMFVTAAIVALLYFFGLKFLKNQN